jgi:phage terminase large subunit-like protein
MWSSTSSAAGWIVPWVVARCERNAIRAVVIDGMSPAASLIDELSRAGVKVTTTGARDMATACGTFYDSVMDARVRHTDQPQVTSALAEARKRPIGDAWGWNRKNSDSDITPVVSVTLALWGAQNSNVKKPTRKRSTQGRRAVVM